MGTASPLDQRTKARADTMAPQPDAAAGGFGSNVICVAGSAPSVQPCTSGPGLLMYFVVIASAA
jgi:hypothetical protein